MVPETGHSIIEQQFWDGVDAGIDDVDMEIMIGNGNGGRYYNCYRVYNDSAHDAQRRAVIQEQLERHNSGSNFRSDNKIVSFAVECPVLKFPRLNPLRTDSVSLTLTLSLSVFVGGGYSYIDCPTAPPPDKTKACNQCSKRLGPRSNAHQMCEGWLHDWISDRRCGCPIATKYLRCCASCNCPFAAACANQSLKSGYQFAVRTS